MEYEIEPEPDEATRKAILSALAAAETDQPGPSPWAEQLLPDRDDAA